MLAIIDYGAGNTYNVEKTFAYLGVQATLTADPAKILASDGLILPGVGAFNAAMTNLKQRGLVEPIKEAVKKGTPFLGICLGMQMLFDYSTEYGQTAGLGFIPGQVVELPKQPGLLVPEVGWNQTAWSTRRAPTGRLTGNLPTLSTPITPRRRSKTSSRSSITGYWCRRSFKKTTWWECSFTPKRAARSASVC